MTRFDWYQASTDADPYDVACALQSAFDLSDIRPGRPKNGYLQGVVIGRGDDVLAEVWWGGNPGTHVKGTGENSPEVAEVLRSFGPHRVSRADACRDWVIPGLFDELSDQLMAFAEINNLKINQQGDWQRGEARTLYIGSRSAPAQLVLYEKGYQTGGDPNHVRMEVRIRPVKDGKETVAHWEPGQCFSATKWLREIMGLIGMETLEVQSIGTVWKPSDAERARAALVRQYGATMREWAEEVGSWETLAEILSDMCQTPGRLSGAERVGEPNT